MNNKWVYSGFKNEGLYPVEYRINLKIKALKELIVDDEKSVLKIQNNFEVVLKSAKHKEIEEQHRDTYEEYLIDRELITQNILIQKRYSTCLLVFSIFEGILKETCSEIKTSNQPEFEQSNSKGDNDLSKIKNYLEDVIKINFSKIDSSFTKLNQQRVTRNRIAHNNGRINKPKEIQIVEGLCVENKIIKIEGIQYFNNLTKEIETFFNQLLIEVDRIT